MGNGPYDATDALGLDEISDENSSQVSRRRAELVDAYYHVPTLLRPIPYALMKVQSYFSFGKAHKSAIETIDMQGSDTRMCGAGLGSKLSFTPQTFAQPTTSLGHFMKGHYSGVGNGVGAIGNTLVGNYPGAAYNADNAVRDFRYAFSGEPCQSLSDNTLDKIPNPQIREVVKSSCDVVSSTTAMAGFSPIRPIGIDGQLDVLMEKVVGLDRGQARYILESAYARDSSVVFGGSRVRGNYTATSDLDVGFGNLSTSQAHKIIKNANSKFSDGLSLETTKIVPGNKPPGIPEVITTPEEFFQRSGVRLHPDPKAGQLFTPSGSITVNPDGSIVIIPAGAPL